jgi:DNA-binding SARP family transcriptional activator/tetratricopeptide (TPR) repeat protein
MRYCVLGAFEVRNDDRLVPIQRPRTRALLAYLALNAGRPVSASRLVDALWGGTAPTTARAQLQADVSAIRRALRTADAEPLVTRDRGYLLQAGPGELDYVDFNTLIGRARGSDLTSAVPLLREALALWRGSPLADINASYVDYARIHLEEQRLAAYELLAEAELSLGRHLELASELADVARSAPGRERLWCQLMLALYRAGRRAEALTTARELRHYLASEHGLDPGRALTDLERRILQADPGLDLDAPTTATPTTATPTTAGPGAAATPAGPPASAAASAPTLAAPTAPALTAPPDGTAPAPTGDPATGAGWPVLALLPPDIADFTGREAQVEQVCAVLSGNGEPGPAPTALTVVAIAGMGGIGKTAFALHVAHRVAHRYPDGQLYVNLRSTAATPLDPADVLARLLRSMGIEDRAIPLDPVERAERYRSCLAGRRVLVVLDDAACDEQIRSLLPGAGTCAVIVTSRTHLAGVEGARWVHLELFTDEEALCLLGTITDDVRVASQPEAAAAIVRLCGRLPLAVRVAGARLTSRPGWPLARLAAQLTDECRRLDRLETGDLAVRASLALSYRALDEPARRLFRLLGLFDLPDFPAWLAAAVLDVPHDKADLLVDRLVDEQLLTEAEAAPGQVRYRFHDLVRLYARELVEREEDAGSAAETVRRGLGAYLGLAERMAALIPGPCYAALHGGAPRTRVDGLAEPADPLAWFETERGALICAVRQSCDIGSPELAFDLAGCLEKYFDIRGMYADWCATNEYVLRVCEEAGSELGQAVMLRGLIEVRTWHSAATDGPAMLRLHADATLLARLFTAAGERRGLSDAACLIAWALAAQGSYATALRHAGEALELAERHGHLGGQARAHVALAVVHAESQRLDTAFRHLSHALELARRLGNVRYEATVLQFLGIAYTRVGELDAAEQVLELSLAVLHRYRDRYVEALTLIALARLLLKRGDPRARPSAEAALAIAREYTLPHHIADALGVLGEIDLAEGRDADAVDRLEASVRLWRVRGWPSFLAAALSSLGDARAGTDRAGAVDAWSEARDIFARLGQSPRADELARLIDASDCRAAAQPGAPPTVY